MKTKKFFAYLLPLTMLMTFIPSFPFTVSAATVTASKPATDGVYSFEMPAENVTITAAFAKICDHSGSQHTQATDNGDGTHSFECTICGAIGSKSHNFGSGNTCSCGIEIAVTGMSLVADSEYRYDAETNTYTVVVAPDDMFVNVTVKFNGENLGYITEDNVMQLYERDDNIFPNSYINSVFALKNNYFSETWGINLRHYGDDVWFAYRFSNDGGTTWSKALKYELAQAYSITANDSENGTVCIDGNKTYAIDGETVTLNVTPAENYTIDTVSYNDGARDVEVTANEGIYSFAMPAGNVTVSATFKEVPQPEIKSITFNTGSSAYDAATNTFYIDAEHPLILTVTGENMLGQNMRFLVANANVDAVYEDVTPIDNSSFTYTVNEEFYRLIMESFKASGYDANIVYVGMCFADKSPSMDDLVELNVTKKIITIDETAQTYTYDGVGKTFAIIGDETNGFVIRYEQNGSEVTALNAGVYDVVITRSEDGIYKEFAKTLEGALIIAKAIPTQNAEKLTTARVQRGQKLATATVTNGEFFAVDGATVLEGTFAWIDDTKEITADSTEKMKFTPVDTNYAEIEFDVAVDSYASGGSSVTRYTVKFDTDGGSELSKKYVARNTILTEPTEPTKEGYIFEGWFTDEELTEAYDFETKVNRNFTLFAKWTEEKDDTLTEPNNGHSYVYDECDGTIEDNCPSLKFNDLDINAWYHLDTDYVIENDIFRGTTENTFEPNGNITRAMMITVLYRADGEPATNRSIPFADVDMDAYYSNAVVWGQQNGIIKGYSETEFAPDQDILREQIAAIMHRYAKYKGIDVSVEENTNILSYDDFDSISEYAITSMQWAVGSGMIKGKTESTLNPSDFATRAEIAAMLYRFEISN